MGIVIFINIKISSLIRIIVFNYEKEKKNLLHAHVPIMYAKKM